MKKSLIIVLMLTGILILPAVFFYGCSDEPVSPTSSPGPGTGNYSSNVALDWFKFELRLIKQTPSLGFTPPVSSRAFGYTGITLYESVVPGMPAFKSLSGQLNGLPELPQYEENKTYHWPSCANAALYLIVKKLFSNATAQNFASMDSLYNAFNASFQSQEDADVLSRSLDFGTQIGNAIYEWSLTDGGDQGQLHNTDPTYVPPVFPGSWVPTPPAFSPQPVQPHWGNNRPFLSANLNMNQPPAPLPYDTVSTSVYYSQALEVYTVTAGLTQDQRDIALFWSDGGGTFTPPGHWISITNNVLSMNNSKLDIAALAFVKVGIAVSDAFISCWKTKYNYNLMRPITYIRKLIYNNWNSYITTPNFPEYTSGHSTQSAAAAEVLSDIFGYNCHFTDNSHSGVYPERAFSSFFAAANEAALSRLYGGIHYRVSNERGHECGTQIGRNVNNLSFYR